MSSEHVLRIPRTDSEGEYVLVNVLSLSGASTLDLRLLATEGESPYILNLKHSRIQKYRAKVSPLDEAQWEELLYETLLRRPAKAKLVKAESDEALEVCAAIVGEHLAIIFRKNISGITQRLGEITLVKDEAQEVDAIAWASTAVLRCMDLEKEAEELKRKYEDQRSTIRDLQQQLEDLIEAKKQHENALLEKFRDLLNAKKLKIRDQQRLLIGTKAKFSKVDQMQTSRHDLLPRSSAAAAVRKRKAKDGPSPASGSPTASDSDHSMEEAAAMQEREDPPLVTPERSDPSATEDEDEDDDNDDERKVESISNVQDMKDAPTASQPKQKPAQSPPPRRDLPFARRAQSTQNPSAAASAARAKTNPQATKNNTDGDDDDETSDDEL